MKNKFLPAILMIWPYVLLLYIVIPRETMSILYENFPIIYIALTMLIYGLNIWNAVKGCNRSTAREYASWNLLIKLVHIPFYLGVFAIGFIFLLAMVVPALIFISPFFIMVLMIVDFLLMITSSSYGIRTTIILAKTEEISKLTAIVYAALHIFFVLDIVGAIMLYRKVREL